MKTPLPTDVPPATPVLSMDDVLAFANEGLSGLTSGKHLDPLYSNEINPGLKTQSLLNSKGQMMRLQNAQEDLMKKSALNRIEEQVFVPPVNSQKKKRKIKDDKAPITSGDDWFNVPASAVTEETELGMHLLKIRPHIYRKQHYKKNKAWEKPTFFATGTVVDDPKEFYSTRVAKRDRKKLLADEIFSDDQMRYYAKQKRAEVRKQGLSGGKSHHAKIVDKKKKVYNRSAKELKAKYRR